MNRKIFALLATLMLLSTLLLAGCSGTNTMLMGRWKLVTSGDGAGDNQQQYPLPVQVDIYPNGRVDLLESPFGTYTKNRDLFTFKSDDGTIVETGSFVLDYPKLTIYSDSEPVSYVFEKVADLKQLEKLLAEKKKASAAPAAPSPTSSK